MMFSLVTSHCKEHGMLELFSFFLAVPRPWRRFQGKRRDQAGAINPDNVPLAVGRLWRQLESLVRLGTISSPGTAPASVLSCCD